MSWPGGGGEGGGGGSTGDRAEPDPTSSSPPRASGPGPRLQVQRSLSRDTITIHFSAQGREEDEDEEELYGSPLIQSVVTAVEASEEFNSHAGAAVGTTPRTHTPAVAILQPSPSASSFSSISSSWPLDAPQAPAPAPASTHPLSSSSSPVRTPQAPASALPSKPFLSLVKSLSSDVEPREPREPPTSSVAGVAPLLVRPPHLQAQSQHRRHLMKTLVKSLSTDTARPDLDSRLNRHLFNPFAQSRPGALHSMGTGASTCRGGSVTAPSSPLASPLDGRSSSSFMKVTEVEARIEDTRRRLSEVMSEPLYLLSKFMGEEGGIGSAGSGVTGAGQRPRTLSSSACELTSLAGLNGHPETSYSIKEEEGDLEDKNEEKRDRSDITVPSPGRVASWSPPPPRSPSLGLDRCTMSALVRQEDEEFCELYSEDFEQDEETETEGWHAAASQRRQSSLTGAYSQDDTDDEDDDDDDDQEEDQAPGVPHNSLLLLISVVYGYFVLPLPPYVEAVLMGMAAGFMLAILVVWLSVPRHTSLTCSSLPRRRRGERWNLTPLDIKEPGVFKGWMNEIVSYDPETYHATLTHSVFVRLEGSTLRLSKPSRNIPRRAAFNEPKPDVSYISQKIYDLSDSKISLVPQSLARKRVWNKKYPICIELGPQEDFMARAQEDRPETGEERPASGGERPEGGSSRSEEGMVRRQSGDLTLYLFGRTGREKEEWFRRILFASRLKPEARRPASIAGVYLPSHGGLSHSRSSSRGSLEEALQSQPRTKELPAGVKQNVLDYSVYMAQYVSPGATSRPTSPSPSAPSSPGASKQVLDNQGEECESEAWANALIGRIFWDFLGEKYWADMVSKKIQMKLSKIRLPYFMNELTLTELDMGVTIPKILKASKPYVDHQGLWFDLEISYHGSFLMTLETKMNLARLGKEGEGLGEQGKEGPRMYCLADSDEESSSAGSSDEEEPQEVFTDKALPPGAESYVGGHRPSKIIRFMDKIAKSKYFQKATETEFIKKKMEEVSNTPLLLTVEVQEFKGTLAVNIPPPPTDRIWYGFRSPPHLELKARPKLGEREVTFAHVTDWIEKKLDQEFQKIFVMPNMDDIWLPIMHSAMDPRSNTSLLAVMTDALKETEFSCDSELSTQSDM
ncbi:testis-expressed protein 2 isoform X2 [Clupea harengus]|uniref:Testis-expressed protein 2 isoform X2 n=1 Tax=Clupea harengus TaxID=7950 RepID=A0A6P8FH80_CLUHA|nr:testis-expressed protein 2 isoform X2 [Clupea harengus]